MDPTELDSVMNKLMGSFMIRLARLSQWQYKIEIIFILKTMVSWYTEVVDVRGAFSHGEFEKGNQFT